jgi:small-conductance mechanosensitive channel
MFRQIKSAIIWAYIYKFRRRIAIALAILLIGAMLFFMLEDLKGYFVAQKMGQWALWAIIAKWLALFGAVGGALFVLLRGSRESKKEKSPPNPAKAATPAKSLKKRELRSLAEDIIQKKRAKKLGR